MAVPKSKKSKSKTNSRFANWKLKEQNLVRCPQCHDSSDKRPKRDMTNS